MPFLGIAWSFISGGLGKMLALASRLPWWAWVAALALFIGWRVHSGLEHRAHDAAYNEGWSQQHAVVVQEQAANKKNMVAIDQLEAIIRAKNAESVARGAALLASQQESASEQKRLAALAKADRSRVDALDALAASHKPDANCPAPAALLAQIQGL